MAINNIPGVGPLNSDIATAVAAPSAATIAAAVAAPSSATIATAVAAAVPTTAGITTIVQANAGSPFGGTLTNLGVVDLNGVSTATLSSLSGYKYLRFYFGFVGTVGLRLQIRFNSDTAANYWSGLGTTSDINTASQGFNHAFATNEITLTGNSLSNFRTSGILEIFNSNSTIYKIARSTSAVDTNGSNAFVNESFGTWNNTAAISSITFLNHYPSNFSTNSKVFCVGAA